MDRGWIICVLVALLAVCCASPRIAKVDSRHEVVRIDTIIDYKLDSIYISSKSSERMQGDTLVLLRVDTIFSFRIIERERIEVEHVTDSVPVIVEVEKETKVRSRYQRFVGIGFWILLVFVLLVVFKKMYDIFGR